jgi:molybdenum cofactor guanylyltransferase
MLHFSAVDSSPPRRLGAILAGGRSRRFGSPKQLAPVGGILLVERVAAAVRAAGATPVAIVAADSPDLSHLLPCRADVRPGRGPLAGIQTALLWARELGLRGALCVACDLPFLPAALLHRLIEAGEEHGDRAVVPESRGPLGLEPLCAWYPTSALAEISRREAMGELSLAGLVQVLDVQRLPLGEVADRGDPARAFLNVNTPQERSAAEAIATESDSSRDRS